MTGTDRDILISRVIDGEASPEDWSALKALAERDPSVWRDLAGLQQDHAELAGAMTEIVSIADGVDAPVEASGGIAERGRLLRVWGGWAAAAVLAIGWFTNAPNSGGMGVVPAGGPGGAHSANLGPFGLNKGSEPEDYFNAYLRAGEESGNVLGEVGEPVLVQTIPHEDGTYEVRYLRQVMERRRVPQVYGVGIEYDERGEARPVLTPVKRSTGRF